MTLTDLIARVEGASGPDRELDALIDAVVVADREIITRTYHPTGTPCLCARNRRPPHDEYVVWCAEATDIVRVRDYTASVDAALELAERVLPGWAYGFDRGRKTCMAFVDPHDYIDRISGARHVATAATVPLAIILAVLKAKAAENV